MLRQSSADRNTPTKGASEMSIDQMIPELAREDIVEQLLIEYKATPHPELMLYFYEVTPTYWQCACGQQHAHEHVFCGNCGVARKWLRDHTSTSYLASKIMERKGKDSVRWLSRNTERVPVISDEFLRLHAVRVDAPEEVALTRLAGYEGNRLGKLLQYMGRYGTWRRRSLLAAVCLLMAIVLAWILTRVPALVN